MKQGTIILLVVLALVVILVGVGISTFNGLAQSHESVSAAYANVDVLLQRRAQLIPNLVETVKGFNIQEQAIIDSVTEARANLTGSGSSAESQFAAENELSSAISRLLVVVENYPEIKSNQNFIQLMDELSGTENRIATARRDYNAVVQRYNSRLRTFPSNIFAGMGGYETAAYFEAPEGSSEAPVVDFTP